MRPDSEGRLVDVIADIGTSVQFALARDGVPDALASGIASEKQALVDEVFDAAQALAELTHWDLSTLLVRIGCTYRGTDDLSTWSEERLENCRQFLRLLNSAADAVSTIPNRRAVTMTFAELIQQTGQDAEGLADLLEVGDPSPWDYVRLGEVSQAARAARINARTERPEDRDQEGPFRSAQRVHISTPRLEAYVRGHRDVLGDPVFDRIGEHLKTCEACRLAADYLRDRLAV